MRVCPHCEKLFSPNPSPKARSQKSCSRKCNYRAWVILNREKHNAAVRRYRARRAKVDGFWRDEGPKARALKAWMVEIKSKPCMDCGNCFPTCCMEYDHRDGTKKSYNLGSMFAHHYSKDLIDKELAKCDLVCANCHRIRTQKRKLGKKRKT